MAQVYVKYNPYRLETIIEVNGREVSKDSSLYKLTKGKRLQEWIGKFPEMLRDEFNTVDFSLTYYGMALDYDDFEEAFKQAEQEGLVKVSEKIKYIAGKSDDDINEKIEKVFEDLQEGPIDAFRSPKLIKAFEGINNSVFPINVIATMSSGKSTLINALLGKKLMPSKNAACTATITEILDTDDPEFAAVAYDEEDVMIQEVPRLTYAIMDELNDNEMVYRIAAKGEIPFLDSRSTALQLVDTPGPNNSQNQAHKNTTYRAINTDSNNLILYVLNGTQLATTDDASLLHDIAEQMKTGDKQVRDRFLFVVNKMDGFNPEEESIEQAILSAKKHLERYGIENPQIFPCSAYVALNIRTELADINIDDLTRSQQKQLPLAARDALGMIDKLMDYESMHLEQYSTLSPSEQQALNFRLKEAIDKGNTKEQALIHSGIYSIEAAITAYVKKYSKTKKVKDLVETFQEVLEENKVLANAKSQVLTDENAAKECAERAATIKKKIADGKEAAKFKEKIKRLDAMPKIRTEAEKLKNTVEKKVCRVFEPYDDYLQSRDEAVRLVNLFCNSNSDAIAELTSKLDKVINKEIDENGKQLLEDYKNRLSKFDDEFSGGELDFQTVDLIKGALKTMQENAVTRTSIDFASKTVEELGETTYEERLYYEKVGQEEEVVAAGSHQEKVGTKKEWIGSHQEKVGTKQVKKSGFFAGIARLWGGGYETEDVYETVNDFKDVDIYETVTDFKIVMRDVFEERTEQIENFKISVQDLRTTLAKGMSLDLDEGIKEILQNAEQSVKDQKKRFLNSCEELDKIIREKYEELEKCNTDANEKKKILQKNKAIVEWLETNREEINSIIEI